MTPADFLQRPIGSLTLNELNEFAQLAARLAGSPVEVAPLKRIAEPKPATKAIAALPKPANGAGPGKGRKRCENCGQTSGNHNKRCPHCMELFT